MTLPWTSALATPAVRISAALHAALALALCFVPLFDGLGFERAFAAGLLATFTSPAIAAGLVGRARRRGGALPGHVAARAITTSLLALAPHALFGWLVEALTQSCNQQAGLLFLTLVAGGNAAFGASLGLVAGAASRRARGATTIVAVALSVFLGLTLWRLYAEPQIFVYNTPFGFWPGSLYDEALEVSGALWAFRGYTALYTATLVSAFVALSDERRLNLGGRLRFGAAALTAALGVATWQAHGAGREAGFDLDEAAVQDSLSRRIETEHFLIFADPSISEVQAGRLAKEHELRHTQLRAFFETAPEGKITSYVYANPGQKASLMGAGQTQIARPWAQQIHIHGFDVPHGVLKHELAHIFAGQIAEGPFKVPGRFFVLVNIGVVEGVAVAADWPTRELTVHGWTRAMRSLGLAPDMRKMLSPFGFWSVSSGRAYTVAGSFVRYLYDTYGVEKLAALYSGNDFEAAYGRSLDALVTEWEGFIDALPLPERELVLAEHRFRRPSIFQKVCAHQAANLERRGHQRLASGDLEGGRRDLETLAGYRPKDPGPWVSIADALARRGRLEEADVTLARAFEIEGATEKARARAREAAGGIAWRRDRTETASAAYSEVLKLHLSTPTDRLQQARLTALGAPEGAQSTLRSYLLQELPFSRALVELGALARARPEDGLALYLYARALERAQAYPAGVAAIRAALARGLPSRALRVEAALTEGRLLLWADRPLEAAARFDEISAGRAPEAVRLEAQDWAARARHWARSGK